MFNGKQICDQCEQSNPAKATHCLDCGAILNETIILGTEFRDELQQRLAERQEQNAFNTPQAITNPQEVSPLHPNETITLIEQITGVEFIVSNSVVDSLVIGRFTSESQEDKLASLDLGKVAGWNGGVSRHHANLTFFNNCWHAIDLNSKNGTYLNGKRIQPGQAYPLNVDDFVSFGYVNFVVTAS